MNVSVYERFGLRTFRFTNVSVYECFCLRTFRFTNVSVYEHFGLRTFRFMNVSVYERSVYSSEKHGRPPSVIVLYTGCGIDFRGKLFLNDREIVMLNGGM